MKRRHKSHSMSHFLLGVPVEIPRLSIPARIIRPVTTPELGFKIELAEPRGEFHRDVEEGVKAFMSIKTYEDALAVLSVYGLIREVEDGDKEFISFDEIEHWVRAAWKVRTASLSDILRLRKTTIENTSLVLALLTFEPSLRIQLEDPPRLKFEEATDLLCALQIVLHMEKLQGIQHKFCALPDCRKPFELKGDKDKKFCSYECSHKSAVRASRERAKEAKSKRSSKRIKKG